MEEQLVFSRTRAMWMPSFTNTSTASPYAFHLSKNNHCSLRRRHFPTKASRSASDISGSVKILVPTPGQGIAGPRFLTGV